MKPCITLYFYSSPATVLVSCVHLLLRIIYAVVLIFPLIQLVSWVDLLLSIRCDVLLIFSFASIIFDIFKHFSIYILFKLVSLLLNSSCVTVRRLSLISFLSFYHQFGYLWVPNQICDILHDYSLEVRIEYQIKNID